MPYYRFSDVTLIDLRDIKSPLFSGGPKNAPDCVCERWCGYLGFQFEPTDAMRPITNWILDHFLLWEWEGVGMAHRRLGIAWVTMALGFAGFAPGPASFFRPIYSAMSLYLNAASRDGLPEGPTTWGPQRPNFAFDPQRIIDLRNKYTGAQEDDDAKFKQAAPLLTAIATGEVDWVPKDKEFVRWRANNFIFGHATSKFPRRLRNLINSSDTADIQNAPNAPEAYGYYLSYSSIYIRAMTIRQGVANALSGEWSRYAARNPILNGRY